MSPLLQSKPTFDQADNGTKARDTSVAPPPPPPPAEDSVSSQTNRDINYQVLEERIKTFEHWPNNEVSKTSLAEAGFIYKGKDDFVVCPFCNIVGYHWVRGDNPMADHRVWSPNCPFFNFIEHDNSGEVTARSRDTCGLYGVEILPNSVSEDDQSIERLGIQKNTGPQYSDKITLECRLATFQNWPKSIKQRPADLAEAGFFYTGVGDQTLCFHCGGGLKDWEENDDPWEQHALWFNKCVYLNLKKGIEYIKKVAQGEDAQLNLPGVSGVQTKEEPAPLPLAEALRENSESQAAEKTLCKICYKNELGVVFLPCGHIVACVDCAAALKNCAICRKPLEATVRAFLS